MPSLFGWLAFGDEFIGETGLVGVVGVVGLVGLVGKVGLEGKLMVGAGSAFGVGGA